LHARRSNAPADIPASLISFALLGRTTPENPVRTRGACPHSGPRSTASPTGEDRRNRSQAGGGSVNESAGQDLRRQNA
jgi:hypothetical protein